MNFRYFFVLALSLILVICVFVSFFKNIYFQLAFIIAMLILGIVIFCFIKKYNFKKLIIFFSIFILVFVALSNIFVRELYFNRFSEYDGEDVAIRARISSNYSVTSTGNIKIVVTNIEISSGDEYKRLSGKLNLFIEPSTLDLTKIKVGSYFEAKVSLNLYKMTTLLNKNYRSNGIYGYAFSLSSNFNIIRTGRLKLSEVANNFVYEKFCDWNLEYAGLGLAMIFGNTAYIGSDINEIFSNTGIAHIVAVSGLNTSILIGIFTFILKKLKVSAKNNFIVNFVMLTIYCYLCGFTISVLRASIMALVSQYAKLRGLPSDLLSITSFVASATLLFNPLMIFNYSFILSFSTVLTIALLYNSFRKIFDKIFYKSFSESLSLTVSVQSWLIFVQTYLFKTFPLVSIIANCIIVPVAVFGFELLLIATPISLIFPFMSFTVKIFDVLMSIVVKFGGFLSSVGLIITIENLSIILVILSFVALFIASEYFFDTKRNKWIYFASSLVLMIITQGLCLIF